LATCREPVELKGDNRGNLLLLSGGPSGKEGLIVP